MHFPKFLHEFPHFRGVPPRLAAAVWWFFALIVTSSYTANLAAFLTKEQMEASISNVEDLATQSQIRYGVLAGGSTESFFRVCTDLLNCLVKSKYRNTCMYGMPLENPSNFYLTIVAFQPFHISENVGRHGKSGSECFR